MKIAVYTIAKNEEQFVERWANSCKEADYRFILDTGSTDNMVNLATSLGIEVAVSSTNPWRFDDARLGIVIVTFSQSFRKISLENILCFFIFL